MSAASAPWPSGGRGLVKGVSFLGGERLAVRTTGGGSLVRQRRFELLARQRHGGHQWWRRRGNHQLHRCCSSNDDNGRHFRTTTGSVTSSNGTPALAVTGLDMYPLLTAGGGPSRKGHRLVTQRPRFVHLRSIGSWMGVSAPADAHLGDAGRDLGRGDTPRELAKGVGLRSLFFAGSPGPSRCLSAPRDQRQLERKIGRDESATLIRTEGSDRPAECADPDPTVLTSNRNIHIAVQHRKGHEPQSDATS